MPKQTKSVDEMLVEAYSLLEEGEYKKADRKFNTILKKDKKNAAALYGKAEAAIGITDLSLNEVAKLYRDAIKLDPENVEYYLGYGAFCLENGLLRQAVENYEKAVEHDQESAPLFYNDLAFGYLMNGTEFLDRQLNMSKEDIQRNAIQFKIKAFGLDAETAAKHFEALDQAELFGDAKPGEVTPAHQAELDSLVKLDDADELLSFIDADPDDPFNYLAIAQFALDAGLLKAAEVYYHKAIDLDPRSRREYYNDFSINYYLSALSLLEDDPGPLPIPADLTKETVLKRALFYSQRAFRVNKDKLAQFVREGGD